MAGGVRAEGAWIMKYQCVVCEAEYDHPMDRCMNSAMRFGEIDACNGVVVSCKGKPLIIGEQPSKNGDPSKPIQGRIGERLAECAGLTFDEYMEKFDRMNLLDVRAEYSGKGMDFNVKAARSTARELITRAFLPGRLILILGKRAASAFGMTSIAYFQRMVINGAEVYVVPHPSGINRWWNLPENEQQMIRFMRTVVSRL